MTTHTYNADAPKSEQTPHRPADSEGLSFDRLGFVRGEDGRAVAFDPVATRRLTRMMQEVAETFKRARDAIAKVIQNLRCSLTAIDP
jgi:hypothetical protein